MCIYCNRSQMTSQRIKNTTMSTWLLFFTRCDVFCDLLLYTLTHARTEKCNLFVLYNKNSNGLLKDFWGMKKEKQVRWRDLTWIWRHLCVCPLIDHRQQPIKMHTEVTLLYNVIYTLMMVAAFYGTRIKTNYDYSPKNEHCTMLLNHIYSR